MKKKIRIVLLAVFVCVFAASAFVLGRELLDYKKGQETYDEAAELAGVPDFTQPLPDTSAAPAASAGASASAPAAPVYVDPYARELQSMDFAALQKVNSDVLGWIVIPGTTVSYPLVHTDNNTYYLTHTWKKWSSAVGAIFLEARNDADFSDFNTVIYGHNMNNGSMFGSLKKYKKKSWWSAHPTVYITDADGSRAYRIFAAYEVSTTGDTYQIGFPSDAAKQSFLDYCVGQSLYDTGVVPTVYDHIVTLSTCTGRGHATRWVIQAAAEGTAPEPAPEETLPETAAGEEEAGAAQEASSESVPAAAQDAEGGDAAPARSDSAGSGDAEPDADAPIPETPQAP